MLGQVILLKFEHEKKTLSFVFVFKFLNLNNLIRRTECLDFCHR